MSRSTLLLSAFGAFPGVPRNPSTQLVALLARRHGRRLARLGVDLRTVCLPVDFHRIAGDLARHITTIAPQAVLHVGVASRRRHLCIEQRALNRLSTLRPDARHQCSAARAVIPHAPFVLRARWPAARLVVAGTRAGAATRLSIDAGDYVCNQTLYLSLATTSLPAGFLHMPQPSARRPLAAMADALAAMIILMMADLRQRT